MALSRKQLKAMGLTEEQVDSIIEAHSETVDGLKEQISKYKEDAEKLPNVQRELDSLKAKGSDGFEEKYNAEHKAFEDYKADILAKESKAAKTNVFREAAKKAGISDKYIDKVIKASGDAIDGIQIVDGKADTKELETSLKTEWAEFCGVDTTHGASVANPPVNNGKKTFSTKAEIMAITDRDERRMAIAKNQDLFK